MDFVTLVFALLIVTIAAFYLRKKGDNRFERLIDQFPGPKRYPFVGTSLIFLFLKREELFTHFRQRAKKYFPIFRSWVGKRPIIHLMSPEHVEVVLNNSVHLTKGFTYDPILPWLGDGLLTTTGAKWHRHRKLITPAFHFKILENFMEVFVEKSQVLNEKLSSEADGKIFDIYPFITLCALDIICETAMGIEVHAMSKPDNEYVEAVSGICELVAQRLLKPWLRPDFVFYNTHYGRKFNGYLSILHGTTNKKGLFKVINDRRRILQNNESQGVNKGDEEVLGKKRRTAFLDLLLEYSQGGTVLTHEQIREEVDTFMFEGHDTTTAAISWTLFLLGIHQNVQEEVYQEIASVLPNEKVPNLSDLGELKLLERVIKESLRLYPSVGTIARIASEDIKLGDRVIPSGCGINVHIYDLHRNPLSFPNPDKFDPDRFLPENSKGRHPYAFIPFSAGPRNCIGQRFAMFEEKTVLAYILRKYKIKSVQTPDTVEPVHEVIVKPFRGLLVTLKSRK